MQKHDVDKGFYRWEISKEAKRELSRDVMVMTGRPGTGKTKWAIMTAVVHEATVIIMDGQLGHAQTVAAMMGAVGVKIVTFSDLMQCSGGMGKVVLDDFSFCGEKIASIEGKTGADVIAVTIPVSKLTCRNS